MANESVSTTKLREIAADRFSNGGSATFGAPDYVELGSGGQTADATSTSLDQHVPLETFDVVDDCDATTGWSATTDGSLALNTTSGEFVEGTGGLNLVKSGTSTANVTYSKTTTSLDWNGKEIWCWFYVDDTTELASSTAVEVRYGSDSSNYYVLGRDRSELADGANWISFGVTAADSTTGSPDDANMDYFAIRVNLTASTATKTGSDMRLDHIQLAAGADYQKSFETNFPAVTSAQNIVRGRVRIKTIDGIGQPVTNIGWFTSDGTLYGLDKIDLDTKSQDEEWQLTDEVQFVEKPN